ncbi:septum formation family protein [Myceligenerans cantabricum]
MLQSTQSPAGARRGRAGRRYGTRRFSAVVACAALLTGALSGCSAIDGFLDDDATEAQRDANGEVTAAADADAMTVEIGDCLDIAQLENQATFTDLPVVPCGEEHTGEIYAEKDLANGEFPGKKEVADEADAFCESEFEPFVGMSFADSELYFWSFYPTEESWAQDDRTLQCVLESDKPVTASLEGVER